MAKVVDPSKMVAQIDAKIAKTSNPRHRAMLENFREHAMAEVSGVDVETIMRTQVAEPQYHFWGMGNGDHGPKGGAAVRAHYQRLIDLGFYRLQHDLERIVVDDNHIFLDGELHMVWSGRALRSVGVEVDDPAADYLYSYRAANVFSYDDEGNCIGEDAYSDGAPRLDRVRKLSPEEV